MSVSRRTLLLSLGAAAASAQIPESVDLLAKSIRAFEQAALRLGSPGGNPDQIRRDMVTVWGYAMARDDAPCRDRKGFLAFRNPREEVDLSYRDVKIYVNVTRGYVAVFRVDRDIVLYPPKRIRCWIARPNQNYSDQEMFSQGEGFVRNLRQPIPPCFDNAEGGRGKG